MFTGFRRFANDVSGNFGMVGAILSIPLMLAVGLSVDYARYLSAGQHLQELADGASLSLAAAPERDKKILLKLAEDYLAANGDNRVEEIGVASLDIVDDEVDLHLKGKLPTTFMALGNIHTLDVRSSALALRAVRGSVEVALVLDNTWSMSETSAKGVSKIATLKTAAGSLVEKLFESDNAMVRVGLVPYADYVNVGVGHRNASWLDVPDDYVVQPQPRVCEKKNVTSTPCLENAPKYACTKYVDGVPEAATCGGQCTRQGTPVTVEKEVCSGGGNPKSYSWHGCVGSRKQGVHRLTDTQPSFKYPGYVDTSQKCLNPIVPLSSDKRALLAAIDGMIINIGSYKPYTYIPAGLIWGQNLLSPTEPFKEGAAYDPANEDPRKVVVLMTDGENTLRFNAGDGKHLSLSSNAATAATQLKKTNDDTAAICTYMKGNGIEIFTVAFMVDDKVAKALLEGCATDGEHFYDASDPDALIAAFSGIARSLSVVRLAR